MKYNISRRDFLNGVALGTGTALLTPLELFAEQAGGAEHTYYPPTLTGLRGSHPGSFEVAHALAWGGSKPSHYASTGEHYDMVIVGAGISGLAAARFYQQRKGPEAKILLLDNHDDFGGHAKRNEFHWDGHTLLGVGGSLNLEHPSAYSQISKGLLDDLGVDLTVMAANIDRDYLLGVANESQLALPGASGHTQVRAKWIPTLLGIGDFQPKIQALPLPAAEKDKIIELISGDVDYLRDLSLGEKSAYIEATTYADFLTQRVGLSQDSISIFYPIPRLLYGPAASRLSVLEALSLGCPGIRSMGWLGKLASNLMEGMLSGGYESLYFPDGNASIARLLVRKLIPSVAPGSAGFADIATRRFDYEALDREQHPIRLRLNSTVVGVRETKNQKIVVDYVKDSQALQITADHCVLACYNAAIPYLCPQLPERQQEALRYGVKVPLVMTNVLIDNSRALAELGVDTFTCPDDPYPVVTVPPPTTTGGYQATKDPNAPSVLYMLGVPQIEPRDGETSRELCLRARHQLYATSFDRYEQQIREQLQGLLGTHGFNHETDIKAITVNRWPHGYSYEYMSVDDPAWEEGQAPHQLGRAQFGRISIANSDSEARAYLDAAIDAGWRAVAEQAA